MSDRVTVTVTEGKVCGLKKTSPYSGVEYFSFLGVPYGQPTGGNSRFRDPVKVKPWNNVLNATVEKLGCTHFSIKQKKVTGSEDCLYNNIHTPKLPSKGDPLKEVIVNVHPGAFFHGSPDPHYYGSPDYIMNCDVVFVCVGYRLHILGNLNLNVRGCTGNQALKDIILSLKWIKENIHVFGGNPENITLMGSSSGSAIVHMLLLSPSANGLYHKAILMGMYIFSPVLVLREENASVAYQIACQLGYKEHADDKKKLLKFYQNLDMSLLLVLRPEVQYSMADTPEVFPCSPFMPTPDFHLGENAIFPLPSPKLIPSTNKVPLMVGFCEREAAMVIPVIQNWKGSSLSEYFKKCIQLNPVGWGANLNDDELTMIQKEVLDFYLNGQSLDEATQSTKCDILTDIALSDIYSTLINVVSSNPSSPVYVYKFAYDGDGELCTMKTKVVPFLNTPLDGAYHAHDYSYWCHIQDKQTKSIEQIGSKDRQMIDTMTNLLTSFAKTGDPNNDVVPVTWEPSTAENQYYLNINEKLELRNELLNGKRMEFWQHLKENIQVSATSNHTNQFTI